MATFNKEQPSFKILICLIRIWDSNGFDDLMTVPDECTILTEVKSIEISESFTEVVDTAKLSFPKGTVLRKTVHQVNAVESADEIKDYKVSMSDTGVVEVLKSNAQVARVGDFSVGKRIRIELNYTEDPAVAALTKVGNGRKSIYDDKDAMNKYKEALKSGYSFDGYITQCGLEEPIEIKCEDLAHMLKKVMCPRIGSTKGLTVNDFLDSGGKYKLLENTGLNLYPKTAKQKINIGKFSPNENMTVYELLSIWSRKKLHPFFVMDGNTPCIAVGRSYFSNAKEDSVLKIMDTSTDIPVIDFGYHVANNGLTLTRIDPLFLAVRARGSDGKGKELHLTVMKNPEDPTQYRVVNDSELSRKQKKAGKGKTTVDLKKYTVVDFRSEKEKVTKEQLKQEAIEYFEGYNKNGMDGTLTLFGDLALHTGRKVRLKDDRQSVKNGGYLIGEVVTRFGTNGYRQAIKLPYCIAFDSDE